MILKVSGQAKVSQVKKYGVLVILGLICSLGFSRSALADKSVSSPIIVKGEVELETTGVYDFDHKKEKNASQEYKNAIGYGVTNRWATELSGEFERESQEDADENMRLNSIKFTHMEWENRFQLTEQGKYWLDAGFSFAFETPMRSKNPGDIEGKILLEKSTQNFTHTANLIFNKAVGGGALTETTAGVAWSSSYRLSQHFQPGFEYWADFGELRQHLPYDQQSHQVGPAFYGRVTPHIKYDIGYLFGVSRAAPEGELKWIMEYELMF